MIYILKLDVAGVDMAFLYFIDIVHRKVIPRIGTCTIFMLKYRSLLFGLLTILCQSHHSLYATIFRRYIGNIDEVIDIWYVVVLYCYL